MVAPCVILKAPRHAFPQPVRAVETITASFMFTVSLRLVKSAVAFGQFEQQAVRLPERRVRAGLFLESRHRCDDFAQAQRVRVVHGATAECRESVSEQIDGIDVRSPLRDAFVQIAAPSLTSASMQRETISSSEICLRARPISAE